MLEEQETLIEKVALEFTQPAQEPARMDPLAGKVRMLEEWYSSTFSRRIAELTELLSVQISEQLRAQFDLECKSQADRIGNQWESTVTSLEKEVEQLKGGENLSGCLDEIVQIENRVGEIEEELEQSFTVDTVPLSRLLQLRTTQSDLKSYLRGLKFCVSKAASQTRPEEQPNLQS